MDAGVVGFADVSLRDVRREDRLLDMTGRAGIGEIADVQVAWYAIDDLPVDIDVVRDVDGQVIAARLEILADLDEQEGTWDHVGHFTAPSGSALGCDPLCTGEVHSGLIEGVSGTYSFQVFTSNEYPGLPFGCRIVRQSA